MAKFNNSINTHSINYIDEATVPADPYLLFSRWYDDAKKENITEPGAIALSTVDMDGKPHVRIVLLKHFDRNGFVFFTNYKSPKANQIKTNPYASFVIFWAVPERQIRVDGAVKLLSAEDSDIYFKTRPEGSKIGAWASPQSQPIPNREYLENLNLDYINFFKDLAVKRPEFWGGYVLIPDKIEFWEGRKNRLHDRIEYYRDKSVWNIRRLAP